MCELRFVYKYMILISYLKFTLYFS
jgi:hypothetical protein